MISSRFVMARRLTALATVAVLCTSTMGTGAMGAGKSTSKSANRGPITVLKLIPDAPVEDCFAAMENGHINVRMSMTNANEGQVYFTNKTDKPLTITLPKAIAGVHVLPQIGMGNGFMGNPFGAGMNAGMNGGMNGMNGMNGGNGMNQMVGGNLMGQGGQNGLPMANPQMNNMPGNNIFSIPPERTVQLSLQSVCLNYGRPEPHPGLTYRLVKIESVTSDPALQQLLEDYSPRTGRDAQQAAAWHLANGLTWEQLANLSTEPTPGVHVPLFSSAQIQSARQLAEQAKTNAAERPKKQEAPVIATTAAVRD